MAWANSGGTNPDFRTGHKDKSLVLWSGESHFIVKNTRQAASDLYWFNTAVYGTLSKIMVFINHQALLNTTTFNVFWLMSENFEEELTPLTHEFMTSITATTTARLSMGYMHRDATKAISGPGAGSIAFSPYIFNVPWIAFGIVNTSTEDINATITAFAEVV